MKTAAAINTKAPVVGSVGYMAPGELRAGRGRGRETGRQVGLKRPQDNKETVSEPSRANALTVGWGGALL